MTNFPMHKHNRPNENFQAKKTCHENLSVCLHVGMYRTDQLFFTSDANTNASTTALISPWKRPRYKYKYKRKHKDQNFSFFLCLCLWLCSRSRIFNENKPPHKHGETYDIWLGRASYSTRSGQSVSPCLSFSTKWRRQLQTLMNFFFWMKKYK